MITNPKNLQEGDQIICPQNGVLFFLSEISDEKFQFKKDERILEFQNEQVQKFEFHFRVLRLVIEKKDHRYTQILRYGDLAIYEQFSKSSGKVASYEVIRIGTHPTYKIAGNEFPAGESYPGSTKWGMAGWTLRTLEEAHKKLDWIKNHYHIQGPLEV